MAEQNRCSGNNSGVSQVPLSLIETAPNELVFEGRRNAISQSLKATINTKSNEKKSVRATDIG